MSLWMKIKSITAREILDSRGNPTVQVDVRLKNGVFGRASVPSGASTGSHEALELRDGDKNRYGGKGVLKACRNVMRTIAPMMRGVDVFDQRLIDQKLLKLDGTKNKSRLGANAILGVSLAAAHAGALACRLPLYRYLRKCYRLPASGYQFPRPMMNIVNGGVHADSGLSIQEFMIIPEARLFRDRVRIGVDVFHALKGVLKEKGYSTLVGDEGGFAPRLGDNGKALAVIAEAVKKAGYKLGKDVFFASDFAASEFYNAKRHLYAFRSPQAFISAERLVNQLFAWTKQYPLILVEDPLAEDDWEHWTMLTARAKKERRGLLLVGDDLFVTNIERLKKGIASNVGNAILIKLNQIGTLTETIDCIRLANKHDYKVIISHRSGETADTTIADLAVAVNADFIKTGSLSRSERVEKYNRLMEIENELGIRN